MEELNEMGDFVLVCTDCQAKGTVHQTSLYVSWDKFYYSIVCNTCGKQNFFDMFGKKTAEAEIGKLVMMDQKFIN